MSEIQKGLYEHYKGKRYEVVGVAWPLAMFQEDVVVGGEILPRFRYLP